MEHGMCQRDYYPTNNSDLVTKENCCQTIDCI